MRVNSKKLGAKESISEIQMGARKKNNGRGKKERRTTEGGKKADTS